MSSITTNSIQSMNSVPASPTSSPAPSSFSSSNGNYKIAIAVLILFAIAGVFTLYYYFLYRATRRAQEWDLKRPPNPNSRPIWVERWVDVNGGALQGWNEKQTEEHTEWETMMVRPA